MTTATITSPRNPALEEWSWAAEQAKAPRLRSMRQFAEQEVVVPTGPFKGLRFRCDRQPFTALWFDEIDSGTIGVCDAGEEVDAKADQVNLGMRIRY